MNLVKSEGAKFHLLMFVCGTIHLYAASYTSIDFEPFWILQVISAIGIAVTTRYFGSKCRVLGLWFFIHLLIMALEAIIMQIEKVGFDFFQNVVKVKSVIFVIGIYAVVLKLLFCIFRKEQIEQPSQD